MNRLIYLLLILGSFLLASCADKEADELRKHLQKNYKLSGKIKNLSSGSKVQYIQMEESINKQYIKELDSLINTAFERQLKQFEDDELGIWASYMNMFSWLFKSKQVWDDEMIVLSNKYFNTIDILQEQHILYLDYTKRISELRNQFIESKNIPAYSQIDLPSEKISLDSFSVHARNNIGIEVIGELLGTKLFSWFLGFVITWILVTILGLPTGPPGWLISALAFIIMLITSIVMSINNDNKLMRQIKEQHQQTLQIDTEALYRSLNENTANFYENK